MSTSSSSDSLSTIKKKTRISDIVSTKNNDTQWIGAQVTVKGWVRTVRKQKSFSFMELNDGSCLKNLQIILDTTLPNYEELTEALSTGAAVSATGELVESPAKGQAVEMRATQVKLVGTCDATSYPLQKKRHGFEFLRTIAHLRPRTNTLGAVSRIRSRVSFAIHKFFQDRGFFYVHTPIISTSDCEGAGDMFRISTLDPEQAKKADNKETGDFFGKPAFLTVSGQLEAEIYATALSDVYTFGPTFRAENSNTSRHLAEFWMVEPEMAFADLEDDIDCAQDFLRYLIQDTLEHCEDDLAVFDRFIKKGLISDLKQLAESPFERITYTEAISILEKSGKSFEFPVSWGCDLQSEHERYIAEQHFKKPVVISDYPASIKAFYMRANDDGKTVAAMDVIVPGWGKL